MSWYDDPEVVGRYIKMPKYGESIEVHVQSIEKFKGGDPRFNFKKKDGTNFGWNLRVLTEEGILTVNSFALMGLLREQKVDSGDKIIIRHPGEGKYELEILEKGMPGSW